MRKDQVSKADSLEKQVANVGNDSLGWPDGPPFLSVVEFEISSFVVIFERVSH